VLIHSLPPSGGHHTRNFVFDTANGKIYLQIGSNGNMDTTDFADRAQIVEMNPDGSGYRTYARGTRNAVGMDIDPRTGALWVNNNGMDDLFGSGTELTDNNPSESIYLVCDGANYGWPYCYAFQMRNPIAPWVNLDTNVVKTFDGPVAEVLAHSAPLGLHFYRGTKFPEIYHNAIFQCYHGSWDRSPPAPPRITVMWADTDGHNAKVTDFVNGFFVVGPNKDSTNGYYFCRPVSIIEGADSALYVSDDQEGVIYRIAYTAGLNSVATNPSGPGFELGPTMPNPAGNGIRAYLTLNHASLVIADVFDQSGKMVKTIMDSEMDSGKHTLAIDTTRLLSGNYTLRVATCTGCTTSPFVIQR
jgi:glucose/arabinose dehydrogenase